MSGSPLCGHRQVSNWAHNQVASNPRWFGRTGVMTASNLKHSQGTSERCARNRLTADTKSFDQKDVAIQNRPHPHPGDDEKGTQTKGTAAIFLLLHVYPATRGNESHKASHLSSEPPPAPARNRHGRHTKLALHIKEGYQVPRPTGKNAKWEKQGLADMRRPTHRAHFHGQSLIDIPRRAAITGKEWV